MPGDPDPLYVAARRVLLDALEALAPHLSALVLVGAQAVYLHAGEAGLAVAPFTTDADLVIEPARLGPEPRLEEALRQGGFARSDNDVGIWQASVSVAGVKRFVGIDLLVPETLGGVGRRSARIPPHAERTARKAAGLEGALVDWDLRRLAALEPGDPRGFQLRVAGPAALIVAKVHKIMDRQGDADRSSDKDALDVYRLLRAIPTHALRRRFLVLLADPLSRAAARLAQERFQQLFGHTNAPGTQMAVRAAAPLESPETLAASLAALSGDLLAALE
jgi:hypothetical protein